MPSSLACTGLTNGSRLRPGPGMASVEAVSGAAGAAAGFSFLTAFGFAALGVAAAVIAGFTAFFAFAVLGVVTFFDVIVFGVVAFGAIVFGAAAFVVLAVFLLNGADCLVLVFVPAGVWAKASETVSIRTKIIHLIFMTGSPYLAAAAGVAGAVLLESWLKNVVAIQLATTDSLGAYVNVLFTFASPLRFGVAICKPPILIMRCSLATRSKKFTTA